MVQFVRGFFGVMTLLFIYAAVMQWNDPDPLFWMVMYGAAALFCAFTAAGKRVPMILIAHHLLVTLSWAIPLIMAVVGGSDLQPMFPADDATGSVIVDTEEGREAGGLVIVSLTLIPMLLVQRGRRE